MWEREFEPTHLGEQIGGMLQVLVASQSICSGAFCNLNPSMSHLFPADGRGAITVFRIPSLHTDIVVSLDPDVLS